MDDPITGRKPRMISQDPLAGSPWPRLREWVLPPLLLGLLGLLATLGEHWLQALGGP